MFRKSLLISLVGLCIFIFPLSVQASDGAPLQKDIPLEYPTINSDELPNEVTFNLYDSKTANTPIGVQTFARGEYSADFEFSNSDGIKSDNVARIKVNFTNKLVLKDDAGSPIQPKEIWAGITVDGNAIGDRSQVSDEAMVQLLLASDASIGGLSKQRERSFRPNREPYLREENDTLLHGGYKYGSVQNGTSFEPLTLNERFSVELIVMPYAKQRIYAHIIGNHPGYKNFELCG